MWSPLPLLPRGKARRGCPHNARSRAAQSPAKTGLFDNPGQSAHIGVIGRPTPTDAARASGLRGLLIESVNIMANANEVTWMQVELSDLNEKSRKLYDAYKSAAQKTAEIRKDFEASFIAQAKDVLPDGMTLAFGYKFGRLSVAAVPAEKPKAAAKNTFKLGRK
jgi:hypothetical protein